MEQLEQSGTPSRNTKCRAWVFTWNNYNDSDIAYLQQKLASPHRFLFGEEKGNSGTPHLQGVCYFKTPRSFNSVRKLFKQNHIEPCKNWNASLNYCSKDGQTFTNIQKNKTRNERLLEKYEDIKWRPWQRQTLKLIEGVPNDRDIIWIHEEKGNIGKSFLAKYLVLKYKAIIADGKKDNVFNQIKIWLDNARDDDILRLVILDIPRYNQEYINYGMLEQIKNGMIYSGKYEGGTCLFESPHIIVFSNHAPKLEMMSMDRWKIIDLNEKK